MDDFLRIAITPPEMSDEVLIRSSDMLCRGTVDLLHLRFPDAGEKAMRQAIETISPEYYHRVKLHSHYKLIREYGLRGAHLKSTENFDYSTVCHLGLLSKSCHSVEEVNREAGQSVKYEYMTLSPIYDSLSKKGYKANNKLLKTHMPDEVPIIALGGVSPDKFPELKSRGFCGAAMIGFYFSDFLSL